MIWLFLRARVVKTSCFLKILVMFQCSYTSEACDRDLKLGRGGGLCALDVPFVIPIENLPEFDQVILGL